MSDEPKFCKDCKWSALGSAYGSLFPECQHPKAKELSLISGNEHQLTCEAMRIVRCGPEGKLWEPKEDSITWKGIHP